MHLGYFDMHGRQLVEGARVKHFGQRFGAGGGTATVLWFDYRLNKIIVQQDMPDGYGSSWDLDRTERIG